MHLWNPTSPKYDVLLHIFLFQEFQHRTYWEVYRDFSKFSSQMAPSEILLNVLPCIFSRVKLEISIEDSNSFWNCFICSLQNLSSLCFFRNPQLVLKQLLLITVLGSMNNIINFFISKIPFPDICLNILYELQPQTYQKMYSEFTSMNS